MAMDVLLSIRPRFAESILRGDKRYEFRRSIFKDPDVERIYIYSTSPVMRIVGYFTVRGIFEGSPESLWSDFHAHAGIDEQDFFEYFSDRERGFAIGIGDVHAFPEPVDPNEAIPGFRAPQNFMYLPAGVPEAFDSQ